MTYKTRNRSNDNTESQKEKETCFDAHFSSSQSKITGLRQNIDINIVCINIKKSFNEKCYITLMLHENHTE